MIFGYQFYLNVDKITLEKYNYKTTKFEEHEIIHFNDEHKHSEGLIKCFFSSKRLGKHFSHIKHDVF